jgi:hypothetical protein
VPEQFQDGMCLGQVLVDRALALNQVGNRVEPQRVDAQIEPEPHEIADRAQHLGVVEVQVGLVREKAMPVVLACDRIVGPVRFFGVRKDDARACVLRIGVAPHVVVAFARTLRGTAGTLKPWMLVGCVVDDELGQDADIQGMRCIDEPLEIVQCAVDRIDRRVVCNVVAVVSKRRRIERQQPQARDAEVVQVRKLLCEPGEIAYAVRIAVVESADVHLVDDCVFVPERIGVTYLRHGFE